MCNRFPWVTLCLFFTEIVVFFTTSVTLTEVAYDPRDSLGHWKTVWTHAFFHVDTYHLYSNMFVFLFAGALLEATDTNSRLLLVVLCSIPIAALGHGIVSPSRRVIGASGYVYAVLTYQIALLIKNWREMRCRSNHRDPWIETRSCISSAPVRLVIILLLLTSEISLHANATDISTGGHVFGALSGLLIGLAVGTNVTFDWWELTLPVVGLASYLAVGVVGFPTRQVACGTYALLLSQLVAFYAAKELRRWARTPPTSLTTTRAAPLPRSEAQPRSRVSTTTSGGGPNARPMSAPAAERARKSRT